MFNKSIQIEVRNVYGENKVYPICTTAKTFARIAGTTTLTVDTMNCIISLGYAVDNVTKVAGWK